MLIIDCHAHIYSEDFQKYPIIEKPFAPPKGKGTLKHLRQEMKDAGVKYVTAVQTKTYYNWDNRFLVDAARASREYMVGVCLLDPDDPHSPGLLEQYVRDYNVRSLRNIPAKSGKLVDPGNIALWETAQRLGIVVCVLLNRDKRGELETMLQRFRKVPVVLDHCLNIDHKSDVPRILEDVVALAKQPNLYAKLSFMATGSAEQYPLKDMHEPCKEIIKVYTPHRCIWGSDFPCELWCPKVTYAQNLKLITHEMGLDQATQEAILGTTPKKLFFADRKG